MYVLIIIFIVLSLLIGLFSTVLVGREVVIEEKKRRNQTNESVSSISPTPVATTAAIKVEEETSDDFKEGTVAFSTGSQTLDEKYLALNAEYKGYYDEIVRYAMAISGSKRIKNSVYEEYKIGKNRLVRLKIKRGYVICELVIYNQTFKNYIDKNKISIKQAPASIKVIDESTLAAVKDSIAIAVKAIEEEKAYKKEQAKLRRKQNKAAIKEASK